MPSFRIELINNRKHTQRSIVLVSESDASKPTVCHALILKHAKNKLRISKAARLFDHTGHELEPGFVCTQNMSIFVSVGEEFIASGSYSTTSAALSTGTSAAIVRIIAEKSLIEAEASRQLNQTALLPGMLLCAGMPDLHAGKQSPIGACFITHQDWVYPSLIGGDIGCGMALWKLDSTGLSGFNVREVIHAMKDGSGSAGQVNKEVERLGNRIRGIEGEWTQGSAASFLASHNIAPTPYDSSLGTIGAGNHFAELQCIETVLNPTLFTELSLDMDTLYLLVHSGSRGYGQSILDSLPLDMKKNGIHVATEKGQEELRSYLEKHDHACEWARRNRDLIALRILEGISKEADAGVLERHAKVLDIWHNNLTRKQVPKSILRAGADENEEMEWVWLHRKGAAPSDKGPVVIPGSRGAFSYLVLPTGPQTSNAYSLAHGAGRKLTRTRASTSMRQKYSSPQARQQGLERTRLGSLVLCDDRELLYEEAPEAYKDVEDVVKDLADICQVVCVLRPIVTYKMRQE